MIKQYKISFCTTCKGRIDHLKITLPQSLRNSADYPNVEFVILDYDSKDGLKEWMEQNFKPEIASGKIRYAHYAPAPYFKYAHAKNIAHRLATGQILCNLDADNIVEPGFASWLNHQFSENPNSIISPYGNSLLRKLEGVERAPSGSRGRIALSSQNFNALRGYDEYHDSKPGEDKNLRRRAQSFGLERRTIPAGLLGIPIQHSDARRNEYMPPERQQQIRMHAEQTLLGSVIPLKKLRKLAERINEVSRDANPDGIFGAVECGATLLDIDNHPIQTEYLYSNALFPKKISYGDEVRKGTIALNRQ